MSDATAIQDWKTNVAAELKRLTRLAATAPGAESYAIAYGASHTVETALSSGFSALLREQMAVYFLARELFMRHPNLYRLDPKRAFTDAQAFLDVATKREP